VADQILRLEPKNKGAMMDKAAALREIGRTDDAIKAYDRVLDHEPRDEEVLQRKKEALMAKADRRRVSSRYPMFCCSLIPSANPLTPTAATPCAPLGIWTTQWSNTSTP